MPRLVVVLAQDDRVVLCGPKAGAGWRTGVRRAVEEVLRVDVPQDDPPLHGGLRLGGLRHAADVTPKGALGRETVACVRSVDGVPTEALQQPRRALGFLGDGRGRGLLNLPPIRPEGLILLLSASLLDMAVLERLAAERALVLVRRTLLAGELLLAPGLGDRLDPLGAGELEPALVAVHSIRLVQRVAPRADDGLVGCLLIGLRLIATRAVLRTAAMTGLGVRVGLLLVDWARRLRRLVTLSGQLVGMLLRRLVGALGRSLGRGVGLPPLLLSRLVGLVQLVGVLNRLLLGRELGQVCPVSGGDDVRY